MTAALNLADLFSRPSLMPRNALLDDSETEQWAIPMRAMRLWKRGVVRNDGSVVLVSEDDLPAIRERFRLLPRYTGRKRGANVAAELILMWEGKR